MRVSVPDRPGAFGRVATALGAVGADIVTLTVIERAEGVAIDDVCIEGAVSDAVVRAACESVAGVVVEALDVVHVAHAAPSPTELAARLSEQPDDAVQCLVHELPATLGATWAVAVHDGPNGLEVLAASAGAPDVPAGLRLPFLPAGQARRLPQTRWMPDSWRGVGRAEVAAARLHEPYSAVLLGRAGGPRFRDAELQRLQELTRVAVATAERPQPLGVPATS